MKFITKDQMNIIGLRKVWFGISAVVIVAALLVMFIGGFNLDTDFAGGITLQYDLHKTLDKAELDHVRELVDAIDGITVNTIQKSGDNATCVIIKAADATPEVMEQVYTVLNVAYGAPLVKTEEKAEEVEEPEETTEETAEETAEETTEETVEETAEAAEEVVEETAE